jgi:hypothetical protein
MFHGKKEGSNPAPSSSPQGLKMGFAMLSTTELWVAYDDTDTLYLIHTSDGSVIRTVPAPGDDSSGLKIFGVRASTEGLVVEAATLEIWQGEESEDTMEHLYAASGTFIAQTAFAPAMPMATASSASVTSRRSWPTGSMITRRGPGLATLMGTGWSTSRTLRRC